MTSKSISSACLLTLAALLVAGACGAPPPADPGEENILKVEVDGLRYVYHPATGTEALFDLEADPRCVRNLAPLHPTETARLRELLARQQGVERLEELRRHDPRVEALRGHGYF